MSQPMTDEGLTAAINLLGALRGHAILGCDWGLLVSTKDERAICTRQAQRRVVIHNGSASTDLKVCEEHFDRISALTDPHNAATAEPASPLPRQPPPNQAAAGNDPPTS